MCWLQSLIDWLYVCSWHVLSTIAQPWSTRLHVWTQLTYFLSFSIITSQSSLFTYFVMSGVFFHPVLKTPRGFNNFLVALACIFYQYVTSILMSLEHGGGSIRGSTPRWCTLNLHELGVTVRQGELCNFSLLLHFKQRYAPFAQALQSGMCWIRNTSFSALLFVFDACNNQYSIIFTYIDCCC